MDQERTKPEISKVLERYKSVRADLNFNHRIDSPDENLGASEAFIAQAIQISALIEWHVAQGEYSIPDETNPDFLFEIQLKPDKEGHLNDHILRQIAKNKIISAGYNPATISEELISRPLKEIEKIQAEGLARLAAAS